jgi:hypothetical protein
MLCLENLAYFITAFFKIDIDTMATTTFIVQGCEWRIVVRSLLEFSARRTSGLKI